MNNVERKENAALAGFFLEQIARNFSCILIRRLKLEEILEHFEVVGNFRGVNVVSDKVEHSEDDVLESVVVDHLESIVKMRQPDPVVHLGDVRVLRHASRAVSGDDRSNFSSTYQPSTIFANACVQV